MNFYGPWLGATDIDVEGIWKWKLTGNILDYVNWKAGEPNNLEIENCLLMMYNNQWDDYWCDKAPPSYIALTTETLCEVLFECQF